MNCHIFPKDRTALEKNGMLFRSPFSEHIFTLFHTTQISEPELHCPNNEEILHHSRQSVLTKKLTALDMATKFLKENGFHTLGYDV